MSFFNYYYLCHCILCSGRSQCPFCYHRIQCYNCPPNPAIGLFQHVPKIQMVRLVNRRCFGHSIRLVNLVVLSGQRRALGRLLYGNANEPLSRVGWNYNNCTFNVTRLGLVAYYNGFNLYFFCIFGAVATWFIRTFWREHARLHANCLVFI